MGHQCEIPICTPDWSLSVGVYEVNRDNVKTDSDSDGFNLDMDNVEGATIPVELAWNQNCHI